MQKLLLLLCLFSISTLSAQTAWPSLKELNDEEKSNSDSTNVNGKD